VLETLSWAAAVLLPTVVSAEDKGLSPEVTDRIYIDFKAPTDAETRRIVIGLYGKAAPRSTRMLKDLVSSGGLAAKCRPRETRSLQKEQLEANKVYNSCIESEDNGVTYEYGQIWRIIKDQRIDVGSVQGKFVAREFPTWGDDNGLPQEYGTVSVQRGNESGFGFTIQPSKNIESLKLLGDNVVIGKVVEGMDVIDQLNDYPVVKSSKLNYMALAGTNGLRAAPSRACRYGGTELYCNEFKPLKKLTIQSTGEL
jgi:cyclophilin family peptidyl-prolyl cis-trans isomerase